MASFLVMYSVIYQGSAPEAWCSEFLLGALL